MTSCGACRANPIVEPVLLTPCGCTVCKADAYPIADGDRIATCPLCDSKVEGDFPNKALRERLSATSAQTSAALSSMTCQIPGHNSPIIAFCNCQKPKVPVCSACLRIEHQTCKGTTKIDVFRAEQVEDLKKAKTNSLATLEKATRFFGSVDNAAVRIREVRDDLNRRMDFVRRELDRIHEETQNDLRHAEEELHAARAKVDSELVSALTAHNRHADALLDPSASLDVVVDQAARLAREINDLSHHKELVSIITGAVPFGERKREPRPAKPPRAPKAAAPPAAAAATPAAEGEETAAQAEGAAKEEQEKAPAAEGEATAAAAGEKPADADGAAPAEADAAAAAVAKATERVIKATVGLKNAFEEVLTFVAPRRPYSISEAKKLAAAEKEKAEKETKAAAAAAAAAKAPKKAAAAPAAVAAAPVAASGAAPLSFERSSKFLVKELLLDGRIELTFAESKRDGQGIAISRLPWTGKVSVKLGATVNHKILFGVTTKNQMKERDINKWTGLYAITNQPRLLFSDSQPMDTPEYVTPIKANGTVEIVRTKRGDLLFDFGGKKKVLLPSVAGDAFLVVAPYEQAGAGETVVTVAY